MNKADLNQLVTKQDLENFKIELSEILLAKINPSKDFYTPKEFEHKTGIPYSTVVYKCTTGALKAFQQAPNCSWLIYATEIDRFIKQSNENFGKESN
jgi:hypothetical protein